MAVTEITIDTLPVLFESVAREFEEKKELLCEMDARMGDGDLGLTMSKGYGALPQLIRDQTDPSNIGKTLMKAGMKMSGVVPSTMGTLMSSGIMSGGKALNGKTAIGAPEMAVFLIAFAEGLQKRGKCQPGDRTIYDAMKPAGDRAKEKAEAGLANAGVAATKEMVPKYGKAAVFAAKAKGTEDQGAVAGRCLIEGLARYILA